MTIYHQNIPREFNLSKYKGTDAFHAREWFYALSGRQMLFRYIQSPYLIDSDGNLTEEDQQAVLEAVFTSTNFSTFERYVQF